MNRPIRPLPAPWTLRLGRRQAGRPSPAGPDAPLAAARPGIAARWKPRDRVSAAGN